jgi:hypothetical protein
MIEGRCDFYGEVSKKRTGDHQIENECRRCVAAVSPQNCTIELANVYQSKEQTG